MNTPHDFDETQTLLRDSLQRWLEQRFAFEQRLTLFKRPEGLQTLWQGLAQDLGLLGCAFPERVGGTGGSAAEHLLVMQALGGALAGEPYLGGAVICGGLLARCGSDERLAALTDGSIRPAWAGGEVAARHDRLPTQTTLARLGPGWHLLGRKSLVLAAPGATHFIVSALLQGAVTLVWVASNTPGIVRRDFRTVDGNWASELAFDVALPADALLCEPGNAAQQALERTLDEATLALCAEALGVMDQLQKTTIEHARQRKQFGQPIGAFQVLQHRIADMHIARVQAEALTWASLQHLGADVAQRERAVSSAKVMVSRACRFVGQATVQIHGGMGMTEELAVGHYFRRATMIEAQFGSEDWHLRRVEQRTDGDSRSAR